MVSLCVLKRCECGLGSPVCFRVPPVFSVRVGRFPVFCCGCVPCLVVCCVFSSFSRVFVSAWLCFLGSGLSCCSPWLVFVFSLRPCLGRRLFRSAVVSRGPVVSCGCVGVGCLSPRCSCFAFACVFGRSFGVVW